MDPAVFRAYSVASSTRPEHVREVENQLVSEEQVYRERGVASEDFLEEVNRKFPLNEVSVIQLLEVASQLEAKVAVRRCEQFLLAHSRRSSEEKMELAQKYKLDRLKEEITKPVIVDPQQQEQILRHLMQNVLPHYPLPVGDPATEQLLNLCTDLKKERDKEVYVRTNDNHLIYLGRLGDSEYELNYQRYLEFVRNTDNVPRYFNPIVLQSDDPSFVPPVLPIQKQQNVPEASNNSPAYDYVI